MNEANILVIDDSKSVLTFLQGKLEKEGAKVTISEDGRDGLKRIMSGSYDLVISDVDMPQLNGLDLCKMLKNDSCLCRIPVILISSMEDESDIARGFEAGAAAYIRKSDFKNHLLEVITDVLHKARFQKNRTVLIVDDSLTVLKAVETGFAREGFQVMTARDGREALEQLARKKPDLIISDIDMPVMNGIEFLTRLKRLPQMETIPFLVMSVSSGRSVMKKMIEQGASGYVVKPFNMEQLIITAEKLLSDQFMILLKDRERLASERESMLGSITSLAQALEARDPYTRGHSERVSMIVVGMARLIKLGDEDLDILRIGAKLHDIGKIGIPDGLLLKNGPLNRDELLEMQKHPVIGSAILKPVSSLAEMIPVVLHHHERVDGTGYPSGLKGGAIPLWARCTAVADTYDALITDRPYRRGFTVSRALDIIREVAGTQLCPDCVDFFMEWHQQSDRETH